VKAPSGLPKPRTRNRKSKRPYIKRSHVEEAVGQPAEFDSFASMVNNTEFENDIVRGNFGKVKAIAGKAFNQVQIDLLLLALEQTEDKRHRTNFRKMLRARGWKGGIARRWKFMTTKQRLAIVRRLERVKEVYLKGGVRTRYGKLVTSPDGTIQGASIDFSTMAIKFGLPQLSKLTPSTLPQRPLK